MVIPNKLRFVYRIISACVAGIFLFQQIAWAGDLIDTTLERLNTQQTQTFAPSYLQNQQSVQETLVSQKQDIENFSVNQTVASATTTTATTDETLPLKGPMSTDGAPVLKSMTALTGESSSQNSGGDPQSDSILSITTQEGDIIHYKEGAIDYIEKKNEDGSFTVIKRIAGLEFVDSSNSLKNAEITYSDKTIEVVKEGIIETITRPDGSIYYYNADESVKQVKYPVFDQVTREITSYFIIDYLYGLTDTTDGEIVTLLHDSEKDVYYGSDNKLKRVKFTSGDSKDKVIQYDNGMISYIKDENSREYFFDGVTQEDGTTQRSISKLIDKDATFYFDINNDVSSTEIEDPGGIKGAYDNTGSLIAVDDHGKKVTKEYIDMQNETVIAPIENEWCARRNNSWHYAGIFFGKMSAYDYWTSVSWGYTPRPDGMTYQDVDANLQTAKEELEQARIDMDAAYELERPVSEAESAAFAELKPSLDLFWKFPALLSDYRYSDGTAPSFDLESIKQALPFLKVQYLSDGSIAEITKSNNDRIFYKDGALYRLEVHDGTIINYNEQNLPESVTKPDKTTITNMKFNPATVEILDADISSPDGTKKTYRDGHLVASELADKTKISYDTDGKIISYTTPDGRTVDLTSQTTNGNNTIITLEDPAKGETSTYENGILKEVKNYINIITNYAHDEEGYLIQETSAKANTLLHDYSYTYANNLITGTDETGTSRIYDPSTNQLTKLELPGNKTYLSSKTGDTTVFELETSGETLPNDTIVTIKYDKNNQIIQTIQANGTVTNYENGKPRQILDKLGNIMADYIYDSGGKLEKITLVHLRNILAGTTTEDIAKTYAERDNALVVLNNAVQTAKGTVDAKYAEGMAAAQTERDRINALPPGTDTTQFLETVEAYEIDLKAARDKAYTDIDNEKISKEQEIQLRTQNALNNLQANTTDEITRQETLVLANLYYQEYLGRTASNDEMSYWQSRALQGEDITGSTLSDYLEKLPEHQERLDEIERMLDAIKMSLYTYIKGSAEEKTQLISSLGLNEGDVVLLSDTDFIGILGYLYQQSPTFARDQVDSLKNLLGSNGINVTDEELTKELILTDILTGSMNFETKEIQAELKISNKALEKVAEHYGVVYQETEMTGVYLSSNYAYSPNSENILIDNNQIAPNEISEDTEIRLCVTRGDDIYRYGDKYYQIKYEWHFLENGQYVCVAGSADGFTYNGTRWIWINAGPGSWSVGPPGSGAYIFTADGRWISIPATDPYQPDMQDKLNDIGSAAGSIGSAIDGPLGDIGNAATNTSTAIGNEISAAAGAINTANSDISEKTSISMTHEDNLTNDVLSNVKRTAMNNAVSQALKQANVDPAIANAVSALISSGAMGPMNSVSDAVELAIQKGMELEQMQSANSPGDESIPTRPAPSTPAELDSQAGLNNGIPQGLDPNSLWKGVLGGLSEGVTSVGINYDTADTGLDPLGNLGFDNISNAISDGLEPVIGQNNDVFGDIFDTYLNNAATYLKHNPTPKREDYISDDAYNTAMADYNLGEAGYISDMTNFGDVIKATDLATALDAYGSTFFNSDTVNTILRSGKTIGEYFNDKLNNNDYAVRQTEGGKEYVDVSITDGNGTSIGNGFFERVTNPDGSSIWDLCGKQENYSGHTLWGIGDLGKDEYGNLGFWDDATLMDTFGSDTQLQRIKDGHQTYAEIKDSEGNTLLVIEPTADGHYNVYDSYGDYVDAVIAGQEQSYIFVKYFLSEFQFQDGDYVSILDLTDFGSTTFLGDGFDFDLNGSGWDIVNTVSKGYGLLSSMLDDPNAYADETITTTEDVSSGQYGIRFFATRPQGFEYGSEGLVNMDVINDPYSDPTGHSFVALVDSSGNIISRGLYPHHDDLLNPNSKINALIMPHRSEIRDDVGHHYSESTQWYAITQQQYNEVLTYLQNETYQQKYWYHLGSNNCTDLPLNIADMVGIELPYADGPYSNPQRFADSLLEAEITEALGYSNFEILQETYLSDGHRTVTIKLPDGSTTNFTLLHK